MHQKNVVFFWMGYVISVVYPKTTILKSIYDILFYWNNWKENLIENWLHIWQLGLRGILLWTHHFLSPLYSSA